jgi:rhamnogalacturonan acetylesterase
MEGAQQRLGQMVSEPWDEVHENSCLDFRGWGQYLGQYLTIPVVNRAIAGRSSRSYTDEGRFDDLLDTVQPNDFVIIEFGHNDGTSGNVDNGRQCAVGDGYNTTATVTNSA